MAFTPPLTREECQSEAGPLPLKRGEIGFQEGLHSLPETSQDDVTIPLPAQHPADRGSRSGSPSGSNIPPLPASSTDTQSISSNSSSSSTNKKTGFLAFLNPANVPVLGGLHVMTILAFFIQIICLGGTLTGWALATRHLAKTPSVPGRLSTSVFVHVVLGLATLGQIIFLERRIFTLRAERYSHLHAGEMLPSYQNQEPGSAMAFAPWNRPPLPTYAAALAQSGVGTGDVEDHLIAAPPPPAYGYTRGSTLLLSGFLRESLRAQRPRSEHSLEGHSSRPVSEDDRWEEMQDDERVRRFEETLAQLERPDRRM